MSVTTTTSELNVTAPDLLYNPSPAADKILGSALFLCMLVGIPGNFLSMLYFLHKKRRDLATCLYVAVCSVDLCTFFIHMPVMLSLLSGRRPVLFGFSTFCTGWSMVFTFQQQVSIFLVLLLSVTRTMVIVRPFMSIRKGGVIGALATFAAFKVIYEVTLVSLSDYFGLYFMYSSPAVYCFYNVSKDPWSTVDEVLSSFFLGVVPVGITASFIISVTKIYRQNLEAEPCADDKKRVTVTMAMFTGIFLVCNTPLFVNYTIYIVHCIAIVYQYPGTIYRDRFMYNYIWPITEVCCMALNAALNPLLYFYRMERLRWFVFKKKSTSGFVMMSISGQHSSRPAFRQSQLHTPPYSPLTRKHSNTPQLPLDN